MSLPRSRAIRPIRAFIRSIRVPKSEEALHVANSSRRAAARHKKEGARLGAFLGRAEETELYYFTAMDLLVADLWPSLSTIVSWTVKVPVFEYLCCTVRPPPVFPSPKDQLYDDAPAGTLESFALNAQYTFEHDALMTGLIVEVDVEGADWLVAPTVMLLMTDVLLPSLSSISSFTE